MPGASAFVEAMDALDAGHDVMVFSDNVPVEQEVALKRAAAERGLLVMGPDCGTAVVGGLGLGFANAVTPGPVGIVAASGTGCQQLLALLDHAGVGVTVTRWASVVATCPPRSAGSPPGRRCGGSTPTPTSSWSCVVSKPPGTEVAAEIKEYAATLGTPGRARAARRRTARPHCCGRSSPGPSRARAHHLASDATGRPPGELPWLASWTVRRRDPV